MTDPLKLPLLAAHDEALQKCVYCPKLSRAACPISNVEANEAVTPWGKMSLAYFAARGDVPHDRDHAATAWACSGCHACRERCEHKNEPARVLAEARAEHFAAGVAPRAAERVAEAFPDHARKTRQAVDALDPDALASARIAVLVGCSYARNLPAEANAIWSIAKRLAGGEVRAVRQCCGLPLYHAGDRAALHRAAHELRDEVADADLVIVGDPGCAHALSEAYATITVVPPRVQPLIDLVYARLDQIPAASHRRLRLRYHDPCKLGRGLGRYEEPRSILARLTGEPPGELLRNREHAECSGAGALLPLTRPATSAAIADGRIAEHRASGAGVLVTACAESLRRFRSRGEPAVDLMTLVHEALEG
jgi:dimethylglycine catabolism B